MVDAALKLLPLIYYLFSTQDPSFAPSREFFRSLPALLAIVPAILLLYASQLAMLAYVSWGGRQRDPNDWGVRLDEIGAQGHDSMAFLTSPPVTPWWAGGAGAAHGGLLPGVSGAYAVGSHARGSVRANVARQGRWHLKNTLLKVGRAAVDSLL